MFTFVVALTVAVASASAEAPVAAPAVIAARSSQYISRNFNALASPLVVQAAPLVAAPAVRAAPLVAAPGAAPLVAAPGAAPLVAAPALTAAPPIADPLRAAQVAARKVDGLRQPAARTDPDAESVEVVSADNGQTTLGGAGKPEKLIGQVQAARVNGRGLPLVTTSAAVNNFVSYAPPFVYYV